MTTELALREARQRTWADAKAIADRAAEENRNFTAGELAEFQRITAALDEFDRRIALIVRWKQAAGGQPMILESPRQVSCSYCGTRGDAGRCRTCGAPGG